MNEVGLLKGKVVVVTGAARGIGRAVAEVCAREGATCVLGDVEADAVQHAADGLRDAGAAAMGRRCDVTQASDCTGLIAAAVEFGGGVDVLVNNAAIGVYDLTVETVTEEQWDRTLAVNLKSVYLCSREAIPKMRERGGGVVINVSSVHAEATSQGMAPYAAAKGGVLALTRNMALDFAADGIRVVAVLPGAVDTAMLQEHAAAEGKTIEELGFPTDRWTAGRVGQPTEVAEVCAFLASDRASFVSGAPIRVDGGLLASGF